MATETVSEFFSAVLQGLGVMRDGVLSAVEINNKIMYGIFSVSASVCNVIFTGAQLIVFLVYNIVVGLVEFAFELLNFGRALLILLWKILILIYNFLDLIFHTAESIISFIWSGGKWTAATVQDSAKNLTENGLSTWKYFVVSVKELSDSILGGFVTIGQIVKSASFFCWDNLVWCYDMISETIFYIDIVIRDLFKGFFFSCYDFATGYLYNIPKEAYIGIACCCVLYITMLGVVNHLYSHGLTFPGFSLFRSDTIDEYADNTYDDYVNEFSDDEFVDLTQDEDDDLEDSDDGTELSDDETEDEDAEFEIDSSNESNTASESEMSEINIQLPLAGGRYDLRRSTTPARARTNNTSFNELEREIETEKEKRKCVVCQDRKKSVLILPCKHLCLCVQCADQIARSRMAGRRVCPLCRTRIKTIMNVYV